MGYRTTRLARYYFVTQIARAIYRILPPSLRWWIPSHLVRQALEDAVDVATKDTNKKRRDEA